MHPLLSKRIRRYTNQVLSLQQCIDVLEGHIFLFCTEENVKRTERLELAQSRLISTLEQLKEKIRLLESVEVLEVIQVVLEGSGGSTIMVVVLFSVVGNPYTGVTLKSLSDPNDIGRAIENCIIYGDSRIGGILKSKYFRESFWYTFSIGRYVGKGLLSEELSGDDKFIVMMRHLVSSAEIVSINREMWVDTDFYSTLEGR